MGFCAIIRAICVRAPHRSRLTCRHSAGFISLPKHQIFSPQCNSSLVKDVLHVKIHTTWAPPRAPRIRLNNNLMKEIPVESHRVPKWYFGGCASAMAACVTHPLDLLKVHLQTAKSSKEFSLVTRTFKIIEVQGLLALYNGLSASLFRQLTYSTTRFGLYEILKQSLDDDPRNVPFHQKVLLAGVSGAAGGFMGTPGDVINVRMQNDIKLPLDLRRNYHHVGDGMRTIIRYEGVKALFSGTTMATSRAVLMTIGQLSVYDQFKHLLLTETPEGLLKDDTLTHITASLMAGTTATTLTQPLDVIKTRLMNETTGHYKGALDVAKSILHDYGPIGFFRGYVPAFVRLAPQTIITFVFLEELRKHFGTPIYEKTPTEVVKTSLKELDEP